MNPLTKVVLAVSAAIAIIGLLWFFTGQLSGYTVMPTTNQPQLRIGYQSIPNQAPIYIAAEKGYWAEEGLDVSLVRFASMPPETQALAAGQLELAGGAETPIMFAALKGVEFCIVEGMFIGNDLWVVARRDKGISSPADLKGKTIATTQFTIGDYALSHFLKENNISEKDIKKYYTEAQYGALAVARGDVDAALYWQPIAYRAKEALGDNAVVMTMPEFDWTAGVIARPGVFENNPEALKKFVRGLKRAEEFIKSDENEAIRMVSKETGISEKIVHELWETLDYRYSVTFEKVISNLQSQAEWAVESGAVPADTVIPDFSGYICQGAE